MRPTRSLITARATGKSYLHGAARASGSSHGPLMQAGSHRMHHSSRDRRCRLMVADAKFALHWRCPGATLEERLRELS